jgi:hypothetical protein
MEFGEKDPRGDAKKFVKGRCHCNDHSFSIEAAQIRFGFASCHCSVCRTSHAAPFVMWGGMNAVSSTPDIFSGFHGT